MTPLTSAQAKRFSTWYEMVPLLLEVDIALAHIEDTVTELGATVALLDERTRGLREDLMWLSSRERQERQAVFDGPET